MTGKLFIFNKKFSNKPGNPEKAIETGEAKPDDGKKKLDDYFNAE